VTNLFKGADFDGAATQKPIMSLHPIANQCAAGSCPTIYRSDSGSGSVVVQGFIVRPQQTDIDVPEGEALVEIPVELLAEAIRQLP
jgi:hypothetical protein